MNLVAFCSFHILLLSVPSAGWWRSVVSSGWRRSTSCRSERLSCSRNILRSKTNCRGQRWLKRRYRFFIPCLLRHALAKTVKSPHVDYNHSSFFLILRLTTHHRYDTFSVLKLNKQHSLQLTEFAVFNRLLHLAVLKEARAELENCLS